MNLQLSLKRRWFEMTKEGIKTEDYREITPYWIKRLLKNIQVIDTSISYEELADLIKEHSPHVSYSFIQFDTNIMTLGYPKSTDTNRIFKTLHKGIEVGTGKQEWGAEPGKIYFIIKHGIKATIC